MEKLMTICCPNCGHKLKVPENTEQMICKFCAEPIDLRHFQPKKDRPSGIDIIRNSLPDSFFSWRIEAKQFNAAGYPEEYEKYRNRFLPALEAFREYARTEPDAPGQFADLLLQGFQKSFQGKKKVPFDCRLTITVFLIPAILSLKSGQAEQAVDLFLKQWKSQFPREPLGKGTYESILSGFRKKLCYITTAVCSSLGAEDNCAELNEFRRFRDRWLAKTSKGKEKITEYYLFAPMIVRAINQSGHAAREYRRIWEQSLLPCLHLIRSGRTEACAVRYRDMVWSLEQKWL